MTTTALSLLEEVILGKFRGLAIIDVPRGVLHRKMFKTRMPDHYHIVNQARTTPDKYFERDGYDVVYFSNPESVKSVNKKDSFSLISERIEKVEEYSKSGKRLLIIRSVGIKNTNSRWSGAVGHFSFHASIKIILTETHRGKTVKIYVVKNQHGPSGLITNFPV